MPIEALLGYLEREADAEIARLVSEAGAEAAAIDRRAADEVGRRRAAEVARLDRESQAAIRDALVTFRRDQRRRLLTARAEAVDRVFRAADRALRTVPAERYRHRVADWGREALRFLDDSGATLVCRPEIAGVVAVLTAERSGLQVASSEDAAPGILARADDGSVVVDNTLPERLSRRRAELAIRLAARLGGGVDAVG